MTGRRGAPVRVSVVEDEGLMRSMLEQAVHEQVGLTVVHSVSSVHAARLAIQPGSTDVVVLDITLGDGNGLALGILLQRADPGLAVLLLSAQDHMSLFTAVQHEMVRPWSYLSKRSSLTHGVLTGALLAVARGDVIIDPTLVERSEPRPGSQVAGLTMAQTQVLQMVAEGLSNRAIAARMQISGRSVESHLRAIYRRLELEEGTLRNRRVAAVLAFLDQTGRR